MLSFFERRKYHNIIKTFFDALEENSIASTPASVIRIVYKISKMQFSPLLNDNYLLSLR